MKFELIFETEAGFDEICRELEKKEYRSVEIRPKSQEIQFESYQDLRKFLEWVEQYPKKV